MSEAHQKPQVTVKLLEHVGASAACLHFLVAKTINVQVIASILHELIFVRIFIRNT